MTFSNELRLKCKSQEKSKPNVWFESVFENVLFRQNDIIKMSFLTNTASCPAIFNQKGDRVHMKLQEINQFLNWTKLWSLKLHAIPSRLAEKWHDSVEVGKYFKTEAGYLLVGSGKKVLIYIPCCLVKLKLNCYLDNWNIKKKKKEGWKTKIPLPTVNSGGRKIYREFSAGGTGAHYKIEMDK